MQQQQQQQQQLVEEQQQQQLVEEQQQQEEEQQQQQVDEGEDEKDEDDFDDDDSDYYDSEEEEEDMGLLNLYRDRGMMDDWEEGSMRLDDQDWARASLRQLRTWVMYAPFCINEINCEGHSILEHAVGREREEDKEKLLAFVTWLIDEQGADVNYKEGGTQRALCNACSPELVSALMDRGADPGPTRSGDWTALMWHIVSRRPKCVARVLEYPAGRPR